MRHTLNSMALAALLGLTATANAASLQITPSATTDFFDAEPGQSIPTGTGGYVGGLLTTDASSATFTYGPPGLVAGASGHGNSTNINLVWFGSNFAAAIAAGDYFINNTFTGTIASTTGTFTASTVGDVVSIAIAAGSVPFHFYYDISGATGGPHSLDNGQRDDTNGAYLVNASLSTSADAGPSGVAYVGLSDNAYPGTDHDFQDLTFKVTVPEPGTMLLLGSGLLGLASMRRRKS